MTDYAHDTTARTVLNAWNAAPCPYTLRRDHSYEPVVFEVMAGDQAVGIISVGPSRVAKLLGAQQVPGAWCHIMSPEVTVAMGRVRAAVALGAAQSGE